MRLAARIIAVSLLASSAIPAAAQNARLGRLFFSADERAKLDALRDAPKPIVPSPGPRAAPAARERVRPPRVVAEPAPRASTSKSAAQHRATMTGFVERSSGANTVWMNNEMQHIEGGYGELDPLDIGKSRPR